MLRPLLKRPGFSIPCIAGLALAIAAATAVFSAFAAIELDPLGFRDSARLAAIWLTDPAHNQEQVELSYADWQAFQNVPNRPADVALASSVNLDFTLYVGATPEHVDGTTVTGNFFETAGARPAAGRLLAPADDLPNAPLRLVLSHRFWRSHFAGDRAVIGRQLRLGSSTATVIGVTSPDFDFPRDVDLWTALRPSWPDVEKSATLGVFRSLARLAPGIAPDQARERLDAALRHAPAQSPAGTPVLGTLVKPIRDEAFGAARPAVAMLLGGVLLLLLIACANAANLTLALHAERAHEFSLRVALGAGRGHLLRLLLAESLGVSLIAASVGLVLARAALGVFGGYALHWPVVVFAIALTVLVGQAIALCGLPSSLANNLALTARTTATRRHARIRGLLIASEVALSAMLVIGAGLLSRSFANLAAIVPGFQPDHVLTFRVTTEIPTQPARRAFFAAILDRLRALPGVESAGAVLLRPLSGSVGWDTLYTVEGQPPADVKANPNGNYEAISAGYFRAMSIPLLAGRDFDSRDTDTAAGAVIVNQSTARRHWPGGKAVGSRLRLGRSPQAPWLTVVGVVADVRYREWETTRPDFYVPYTQRAQHRTDFVVRTRGDQPALAAALRQAVFAVDPNQPISNLTTMDALVDAALSRARVTARLIGGLAFCATGLAAIGIYGLLAFLVRRRTREIGIRAALGARPAQVARLVALDVLRYVAAGLAAGLIAAVQVTALFRSQFFEVSPSEPGAYLLVAAVLSLVAVVAAAAPALRASRIDPATALRD